MFYVVSCCLDHKLIGSMKLLYYFHIRIGFGAVAGEIKRVNRYCSRARAGAKSRLHTVSHYARGRRNAFRRVMCAPARRALS